MMNVCTKDLSQVFHVPLAPGLDAGVHTSSSQKLKSHYLKLNECKNRTKSRGQCSSQNVKVLKLFTQPWFWQVLSQ
jgi:hypothetical protein